MSQLNWPEEHVDGPESLFAAIQRLRSRFPSDSIGFRGQACRTWPLRTTIDRVCRDLLVPFDERKALSVEKAVLYKFAKRSDRFATRAERAFLSGSRRDAQLLERIAFARHSGLPTRALDWTYSPAAAAYFACAEHPQTGPAIWWFNLARFEKEVNDHWDRWRVPKLHEFPEFREVQPIHARFLGLHRRAILYGGLSIEDEPWISAVHFPKATDRIEAQQAFLTICGRGGVDHDQAIAALDERQCRDWYGKFVLPERRAVDVVHMLRDFNVDARSLMFPGVDSVAQRVAAQLEHAGRQRRRRSSYRTGPA